MAATRGLQGSASWASSPFLIARISPNQASIDDNAQALNATGIGTGISAFAQGLRSWTARLNGRFPASAPQIGYNGYLQWTTGNFYDDGATPGNPIGVVGWELSMAWGAGETTSKSSASAIGWREFAPLELSWSATVDLRVDDTEALVIPHGPGDTALVGSFDLDGTNKFTGTVYVVGTPIEVTSGGVNSLRFALQGTGALTAVGAGNIFAAGAVPAGVDLTPATLRVTAATGRYKEGSAFPTSVVVRCPVDGLKEVSVTAQGSGALTPA